MRAAYASADTEGLLRAYEAASSVSGVPKCAISLIESFYPLKAFLELAGRLDRRIADHGLHEGSRQFLQDAAIDWECALPERYREIIETHPVIFFGNHPSLLTPFLVGASVDRVDLHYFSTSYVTRLIPSFGEISHPMEVPLTRSWTEWRRGGWKRALAYRLVSLLHDQPDVEEVRAINRSSLARGASHVRQGGSVMICPGGGGTQDRRWYLGIGSLVKSLQEVPGDREIYLVPIREENCTNKRVYAHLMDGPIARLKESVLYRGPVRITIAEPIPLSRLASPSSTTEQIVEILRAYYDALFAKPVSVTQ
jgi:hypothetical protein